MIYIKTKDLIIKASRALDSAKTLLSSDVDGACNRAYFAVNFAARALWSDAHQEAQQPNDGEIYSFLVKMVEHGDITEDYINICSSTRQLCNLADYSDQVITLEDATISVDQAENFVSYAISILEPENTQKP